MCNQARAPPVPPHSAASKKIRRFFGRQRFDLAALLTATAGIARRSPTAALVARP
jgi:hypothetical protein